MATKKGELNRSNGAVGVLPPLEVRLELDSGIIVHARHLSPFVMQQLHEKAAALYPYPPEEDYEVPFPEGETLIEGEKLPAKNNPEYQELCFGVDQERAKYKLRMMRNFAVSFPGFPDHEAVIDHFADQLEQFRMIGDVPDDPDDLWEFVWEKCVISSADDQLTVTLAINDKLPLTEEEVSAKMRLFRCDLSRERLRLLVARGTRRTEAAKRD